MTSDSSFVRQASSLALRVGRRLFRNTPIQRLQITTWVYRFLFDRVKPEGAEIEVDYFGASYLVPGDDVTIVPSLMQGDYERPEFEALDRLLRPDMVAVDVGANIGLHAVFFGKRVGPNGKVFAFEPEPSNFAFLEKNVARNALGNVTSLMKGAGAEAGTLRLYLSADSVGTHSAAATEGAATVDVPIVRLDEFLRDATARVDLVKIDVEGYETQVVSGLLETLKRDRPALLIEFSPALLRQCGNSPEALLATLRTIYSTILLFQDAGRPGVLLDVAKEGKLLAANSGSRNLLCTP